MGFADLPKVLALLNSLKLGAAAAADRQVWFVVALVFSLVGDVALMLDSDRFVLGLGAFLVAHVAYIVGFWIDPPAVGAVGVAALVTHTLRLRKVDEIPTTVVVTSLLVFAKVACTVPEMASALNPVPGMVTVMPVAPVAPGLPVTPVAPVDPGTPGTLFQ